MFTVQSKRGGAWWMPLFRKPTSTSSIATSSGKRTRDQHNLTLNSQIVRFPWFLLLYFVSKMSSCQKFVSERVFPFPPLVGFSIAPRRTVPEPCVPVSVTPAPACVCPQTVCLVGHSIFDDLHKLLESHKMDLHVDFNIPTVTPVWNAVRGLIFNKLCTVWLDRLDQLCPDIIVMQLAGNDLDSLGPVSDITKKYLRYSQLFLCHLETKVVIICEALPCLKTRHCSVEVYLQRRQRFNSILQSTLVKPSQEKGLHMSNFVDAQI